MSGQTHASASASASASTSASASGRTPDAPRGAGTPLRIVLADDQTLVRSAFAMLIASAPGMTVVGEAGTGREAVALARSAHADLVVMDIRMPDLDGIEATRLIAAAGDLDQVKVLVLTTYDTDEHVVEALRAGASGFLVKDTRPAELLDAIRTVAAGDSLLSPGPTARLIARVLRTPEPGDSADRAEPAPGALDVLSAREREVLALVARGHNNAEIAHALALSPLTAKTHVSRIMGKLSVRDRAQLVIAAYESGLVTPGAAPQPPD
ncbi:response regulator [Streptomyces reniochalinae]|uniref:DNA-binding response regulator n=1 Tax=Streptomyces reniochalinae TaxID=2250578 RepID=A0A367EBX8_9ACTN|nr:response regulator transcription factor [Streptomyces reniochalinae]RCG14730.1 DNA-binding response regulator [Streptomyces reniochalinae]